MFVIEITSLEHPGVDVFGTLTEAQLRNRIDPERGIFIAESPKVIRVALDAGYQPLALLCEKKHIEGDAADIILRAGDIPVYTGSRELLASLTGYTLTRGVLCAMRRPAPRTPEEVCRDARRVAVIHGVVDTTNIGAIFRSAAALGIDAILLSPDSCDPLNRRAVRVSMGSVFLVPWTWFVPCLTVAGKFSLAFGLKIMDAQQGVPSDTYVDARLQAVLAAGVYKIAYDVAFAIAPFYCFQAIWVYIALPESETCFVCGCKDGKFGSGCFGCLYPLVGVQLVGMEDVVIFNWIDAVVSLTVHLSVEYMQVVMENYSQFGFVPFYLVWSWFG